MKSLVVGGAAFVLVALAGLSVHQTGALWSDSSPISGATVRSGILDITAGAGGARQDNYTFAALAKAQAKPGDFAQAPLVIRNSGNIPMNYRLQGVTQSSGAVVLTFTATLVASEAACPATGSPSGTALYTGAMIGAQVPSSPQWRVLAESTEEVWCLRGTVGAASTSGSSTTVTFTFLSESQ